MDVPTITMDPQEAEAKIAAWMREKHADQAEVKRQCIKGYEALAAGNKLLQLDSAVRTGGFHATGFPKLAIARADCERVRFWWKDNENVATYDCRHNSGSYAKGRRSGTLVRSINFGERPKNPRPGTYWNGLDGWSQVPLLPAEHRPYQGQLKDWFILWEAERWFARDLHMEPDRDPMLLEHVAGQLYAVLAEWDLTELERAVMAGALAPEA